MDPKSGFDALFELLPGVSFFAKDTEGRIVAANGHFFRRFGFTRESDILGKDDFQLFPQRLAEHFREDDREVMRSGKSKLNIVELFFNQQGIPDWFITNKLPVRDHRGRIIGVMGTTQSYEGRKQVLLPYLQIDRALAFMRENFRRRIGVEELAAMVHLSSRQLHRKFVETFGSSPQAFLMKLRIQAACEALQRDDTPIGVVARDFGFSDQSAFTQHFHKLMGLTPLRYQRQFRLRQS
ncbi:MAG TPA: AraC family transcriptional regulator [Verrucomicrobiaceae bacterium]